MQDSGSVSDRERSNGKKHDHPVLRTNKSLSRNALMYSKSNTSVILTRLHLLKIPSPVYFATLGTKLPIQEPLRVTLKPYPSHGRFYSQLEILGNFGQVA